MYLIFTPFEYKAIKLFTNVIYEVNPARFEC